VLIINILSTTHNTVMIKTSNNNYQQAASIKLIINDFTLYTGTITIDSWDFH